MLLLLFASRRLLSLLAVDALDAQACRAGHTLFTRLFLPIFYPQSFLVTDSLPHTPAAATRPGRFDLILFVPPPDEAGREAALRIHTRGMPLAPDVDLAAVAAQTPLYTGESLPSFLLFCCMPLAPDVDLAALAAQAPLLRR